MGYPYAFWRIRSRRSGETNNEFKRATGTVANVRFHCVEYREQNSQYIRSRQLRDITHMHSPLTSLH